jgi:Tol biopolymer transport system component
VDGVNKILNSVIAAAAAIVVATASAAPAHAAVRFTQITQSGCCVQPFFSPDGARVLFIDRPSAAASAGIYGVRIDRPRTPPELVTEKLGPFSRDMRYNASLVNGRTVVERSDAELARWTIDNGGRSVSFSPDAERIVWSVSPGAAGNFDRRRTDIWTADIDGGGARKVATRYGGGVTAWLPDGVRVLIAGRAKPSDAASTAAILDLRDGSLRDLFPVERWRAALISPDGRRLIYYVAGAREKGKGGVFLVDLTAASPTPQRLEFFGAYRWRDATRLLYVPLTPGAPSNELWQYDVVSGRSERLAAASADSPLRIAGGDWDVSPDGRRIVFVSARDRAVWVADID